MFVCIGVIGGINFVSLLFFLLLIFLLLLFFTLVGFFRVGGIGIVGIVIGGVGVVFFVGFLLFVCFAFSLFGGGIIIVFIIFFKVLF